MASYPSYDRGLKIHTAPDDCRKSAKRARSESAARSRRAGCRPTPKGPGATGRKWGSQWGSAGSKTRFIGLHVSKHRVRGAVQPVAVHGPAARIPPPDRGVEADSASAAARPPRVALVRAPRPRPTEVGTKMRRRPFEYRRSTPAPPYKTTGRDFFLSLSGLLARRPRCRPVGSGLGNI